MYINTDNANEVFDRLVTVFSESEAIKSPKATGTKSLLDSYYLPSQASTYLADKNLSAFFYDAISCSPHCAKAYNTYRQYVCTDIVGLDDSVSEEQLAIIKSLVASMSLSNDYREGLEFIFTKTVIDGGFACFVNAIESDRILISEIPLWELKMTTGSDGIPHLISNRIPLPNLEELVQFVCVGIGRKGSDNTYTPLFASARKAIWIMAALDQGLLQIANNREYLDALHITVGDNSVIGLQGGVNDAKTNVKELKEAMGEPISGRYPINTTESPYKVLPKAPSTFISPDNVKISPYKILPSAAVVTAIKNMAMIELCNGLGLPASLLAVNLSSTETQMSHLMNVFISSESWLRSRITEVIKKICIAYNAIIGSDVLPTNIGLKASDEAREYIESKKASEALVQLNLDSTALQNMKIMTELGIQVPQKYTDRFM